MEERADNIKARLYRNMCSERSRSKFLNDLHLSTNQELAGELASELMWLMQGCTTVDFDPKVVNAIFDEVAKRLGV